MQGPDMQGRGRRIAFGAACLGTSVAMGVLASAYTTAGMDPFYTQRDRVDGYETSSWTPPPPQNTDLPAPSDLYRPAVGDDATSGEPFPSIPTPR